VRRNAVLAAPCAALLLAGCTALGPDYARPATNLPGAYADAPADLAPAATVPVEWWKLYGDQQLDQLVAGALERNADLRIAVARIEEADANLREAGAALLPEIGVSAVPARSRISNRTASPVPSSVPLVRNDIRLSLGTSFEIDFWGKLRRAQEATRALALGSRYARDVVALSVAGLTAQAYFSLRALDAQIAVSGASLASREETLQMVRRRAQGGVASDLELNQAALARADAATQLNELQRQRALVGHQLAALSGRLELALPAGDLRALPLPPLPPAGLPASLLERRPDVRQAEQQLVASNAQIGIARAAMFPAISLTSYYGGQSAALSNLLDSGARIWSLGFGLALPVFDSGRYAARAEAAEARQKQALAAYQKSAETAFREVADALVTAKQTAAAEHDQQARVQAARNVLRLARVRYEAGYSAYLEVLDAQRAANAAELAFAAHRLARLAASVDLMKALGGGWSADSVLAPSAALRGAAGK
jgi:multidrug efflux system outer membrane protein